MGPNRVGFVIVSICDPGYIPAFNIDCVNIGLAVVMFIHQTTKFAFNVIAPVGDKHNLRPIRFPGRIRICKNIIRDFS